VYNVKTAGKNSYTHTAKWTGSRWISSWQEDEPATEEIKIKEWQGIAYDPDEHFLRDELEQIVAEFTESVLPVACVSCGEIHYEAELPELNGQLYCPDCKEGWIMLDQREEETVATSGKWPF
jgi:formylmethanofuran dehydrogenase subunit E